MHSEAAEPEAILRVWGLSSASAHGPQARLTLPDIAAVSAGIADEAGFEAVTLAAVGSALGVATTALYRYVDTKATLCELMIDHALGPVPASVDQAIEAASPAAATHWVEALWARYTAHPWLATFPLRQAPRCPNAFAWLDALMRILTRTGDPDPLPTALAVDVLVRGYAGAHHAAAADLSRTLSSEIARRHPAVVPTALPAPREQLDLILQRLWTTNPNPQL